jgi:septal ring factor EnvC (AmiA/AmiB activator)
MTDNEKKEYVAKLEEARENQKMSLSILHSEHDKMGKAIAYAEAAMEEVREVLFKLTGSDFYRKKEEGEGENGG